MKKPFLLFISILVCTVVRAESEQSIFLTLDRDSWEQFQIPNGISNQLPPDLEFSSTSTAKGRKTDLNQDGVSDLIIVSEPLCGNGGCPYALFDGATGAFFGQVFGSPVWITTDRINTMPVIESYSHQSAEDGIYRCYVFDGRKYLSVTQLKLSGNSVTELFKNRQTPKGAPSDVIRRRR